MQIVSSIVELKRVTKFLGYLGSRRLVLDDVDACFRRGDNYVILGMRGSGLSTLLKVISGTTRPNAGRIVRRGSVSMPVGSASSASGPEGTVYELVKLLSNLYYTDPRDVIAFIDTFPDLQGLHDKRVVAMPPLLRSRLNYALGYALPCDLFLFDGGVFCGDGEVRSICERAFEVRRQQSGTIVATRNARAASALGNRGGIFHSGKLQLFETVEEAVALFFEIEANAARSAMAYAKSLLQVGNLEGAQEYLKQKSVEGDEDAETEMLFARLSMRLRRYDDALYAVQKILDDQPSLASALTLAAEASAKLGNDAVAISYGLQALYAGASATETRIFLAKLYERSKMPSEAAESWEKAGLEKYSRLALRNYLAAKEWEHVARLTERGIAAERENSYFHDLNIKALTELGRWPEVESALLRLLEVNPERALTKLVPLAASPQWAVVASILGKLDDGSLEALKGNPMLGTVVNWLERRAKGFGLEDVLIVPNIEMLIARLRGPSTR